MSSGGKQPPVENQDLKEIRKKKFQERWMGLNLYLDSIVLVTKTGNFLIISFHICNIWIIVYRYITDYHSYKILCASQCEQFHLPKSRNLFQENVRRCMSCCMHQKLLGGDPHVSINVCLPSEIPKGMLFFSLNQ